MTYRNLSFAEAKNFKASVEGAILLVNESAKHWNFITGSELSFFPGSSEIFQ